jgi:dTDP-4-amino-4,6-dideoxygalactose transaminase
VKLPCLDGWNEERRQIARRYEEAAQATGLHLPHRASGTDYVAHLCVGRHRQRDEVRERLGRQGVATAIHYPLLDYQQPGLKSLWPVLPELPASEAAAQEILTLPCFPGMDGAEIDHVCEAIRTCC